MFDLEQGYEILGGNMRIGMQVWGSDGDIRPMIALAAGLKQAGHEITIMIASVDNKSYAGLCAKTGITLIRKPDNIGSNPEGIISKNGKLSKPPEILVKTTEQTLYPYIDELYEGSKYLCERNELVIGHFSCYYLKIAAKKKGIPYISMSYWPGLIPSEIDPPLGMPKLGSTVAKMSWSVFMNSYDSMFKNKINELFLSEGFPQIKHVMTDAWLSDDLNIVACSKMFFKEAPDWTAAGRVKITGFLNMPVSAEHYQFPPNLKEFLTRRGDHPVFMTLGSSMQADPERGMFMLIEAARVYKQRVIIQTASKKYPADSFLQNIYFSEKMPHREIIHFCSAVVHHCGAGITHTVARHGVPSVPLYLMDEQKSWADKLYSSGIASKPLDYLHFTPEDLAESIKSTVLSVPMKTAAEKFASELHKEDGVKETLQSIESFIISRK
jgi:UDP:flavonoid glycosyltransferase YjiC (YdhE family)